MMQTKVLKWGNSLALRIPKSFALEIGITNDQPVDLSLEDGRLVVTPIIRTKYKLEDMLAEITDENLHKEIPTGVSVGAEVW